LAQDLEPDLQRKLGCRVRGHAAKEAVLRGERGERTRRRTERLAGWEKKKLAGPISAAVRTMAKCLSIIKVWQREYKKRRLVFESGSWEGREDRMGRALRDGKIRTNKRCNSRDRKSDGVRFEVSKAVG
jgi:hypothetical protein